MNTGIFNGAERDRRFWKFYVWSWERASDIGFVLFIFKCFKIAHSVALCVSTSCFVFSTRYIFLKASFGLCG